MTADNAILWLQTEKFNQWRLVRGEGDKEEKVSDYASDEESEEEAINRLRHVLQLLQPGRYTLRAHVGKSKQASASTFRFDIQRPNQAPAQAATQSQQQGIDYKEIFEKAKAVARAEFEQEAFRKEVLTRLDNLETKVADISKSILELNDEDEDNDSDAMSRLTNVAAQLPTLAKGFDSMRGLFKTA